MASNINPTNIDITYPIAGQDNDTQGFRDNFRNIKNNFLTAGSEMTAVQSKLNSITTDPTVVLPSIPPTPTAAGVKGQMAFNSTHFYICVAPNFWRRVNTFAWSDRDITLSYGDANVAVYLPTDSTITSIQSNVTQVNANLTAFEIYANTNFATTGGPSTTSLQTTITTNQTSTNANLNAYKTYANAAIASINSNLGNVTQATVTGITANLNAYKTWANANLATTTNSITSVNANLIAFGSYANLTFGSSNFGLGDVAAYLPTFTGNLSAGNIVVRTSIVPISNVSVNIGSATQWFNTVYGRSIQAQYADLAENYLSDEEYAPGTVVIFGGDKEITVTPNSHDTRVAGVISSNPAYLMNSEIVGLPVALTGRVPCLVKGPVTKGDCLVNVAPGVAGRLEKEKFEPGCIIGKSLTTITSTDIELIEIAVGRY
jgi:hypothetical protein